MIDRRKIAVPLVLVGAGLAVVSSLLDMYGTGQAGASRRQFTSTLWTVASEQQDGMPEGMPDTAYYGAGWPVVVTALAMVAGVVLMAWERTSSIGRPVALAAAGGLAGVVFFYVFQLRHEEALINSWPLDQQYEVVFRGGMYLLIAAVVVGLVGAVLVQRQQQEQPQEHEEEVVVHQLDDADDTPPFGIAMPEQQEQETR